ncbi:MAG: hypothetical protein R2912_12855 [Eubacteriales bacterium]
MAKIYKDFSETNRKLAKKILEEQTAESKGFTTYWHIKPTQKSR